MTTMSRRTGRPSWSLTRYGRRDHSPWPSFLASIPPFSPNFTPLLYTCTCIPCFPSYRPTCTPHEPSPGPRYAFLPRPFSVTHPQLLHLAWQCYVCCLSLVSPRSTIIPSYLLFSSLLWHLSSLLSSLSRSFVLNTFLLAQSPPPCRSNPAKSRRRTV